MDETLFEAIERYLSLGKESYEQKEATKDEERENAFLSRLASLNRTFERYFQSENSELPGMIKDYLYDLQLTDQDTLLSRFFGYDREEDFWNDEQCLRAKEAFVAKVSEFVKLPASFLKPNTAFYRDRLYLVTSGRVDYIVSVQEEAEICSAVQNLFIFWVTKMLSLPVPSYSDVLQSLFLLLGKSFLITCRSDLITHFIRTCGEGGIVPKSDSFFDEGRLLVRQWYLANRFPIEPTDYWFSHIEYALDHAEYVRIINFNLDRLVKRAKMIIENGRSFTAVDYYSEVLAIKNKMIKLQDKKDQLEREMDSYES
jgi:hypothetical protein